MEPQVSKEPSSAYGVPNSPQPQIVNSYKTLGLQENGISKGKVLTYL